MWCGSLLLLVLVENLRRACSCATFSQLSLGCWRIFLLRVTEVSRHAGLAWAKEAVHATRHSLSQQRVDESVGQEWLTKLCADWLEITRNGRFSLVFQEFHWASSFLRDELRNFLVNMNNKSRESCHSPPSSSVMSTSPSIYPVPPTTYHCSGIGRRSRSLLSSCTVFQEKRNDERPASWKFQSVGLSAFSQKFLFHLAVE